MSRLSTSLLTLLFFQAIIPCLLAIQEPVSMVCFIQGNAYIDEGDKRQQIALFSRLNPGTRVTTEKGTKLILVYFSGERFEFGDTAAVTISEKQPHAVRGSVRRLAPVPAAIKLLPVKKGELKTTKAAAVRLRAAGASCVLKGFTPADQSYVLADATTISFEALPDVQTYSVVIEDVQGKGIHSARSSESAVRVPAGLLQPGQIYYWRISALDDRECTGERQTSFVTLKKEDAEARSALERQVSRNPEDLSLLVLLTELDSRLGLATQVCADVERLRTKATDNASILESLNQYACPAERLNSE